VQFLDRKGTDINVGSVGQEQRQKQTTQMGQEVEFNEDDIPF
jgi:hypothetical protein